MASIKTILIIAIYLISIFSLRVLSQEKSSVCFTFDDGNPNDILDYKFFEWNELILWQLEDHNLQAVLYVCGKNLDNENGKLVLESWNKKGHIIANHTYNHLNYNNPNVNFDKYRTDILKCDSLIRSYSHYEKYFRAPYLKSGDTKEKIDSLIVFLKSINYKNGYVTIDDSDWYINSRLIKFMEQNPGESIEPYKDFYIEHILDRAKFYDELGYKLLGRKIKHSLLLHHNLSSALFLGDLIEAFKNEGWQVINAQDALTDSIYQMSPDIVPAGESIIWGLAKEGGEYDNLLRYPAEDSEYEEERMNELGL